MAFLIISKNKAVSDMPRYINPKKIDFRIPCYPDDEGNDVLVSLKTVKRCIAMTPSEDVVPKSEVAREIFEEIENRLGIGHDILDAWDIIAELKKKYTEDKI
jgi:hypothetical protein